MKLFYSPGACSLSPHIALNEAGLKYDLEKVDMKTKTVAGGDYRAVNPKGQVPALLLDDGSVLTEGPAIVQYIADQAPASGLAPKCGTIGRYRLAEWLNHISTEVHKGFSPLFKPNTPDAYKPIVHQRLQDVYAAIDKHLATHTFLLGDTFTVADGYLFTVTRWAVPTKVDLSAFKNLAAYMERIAARPAVKAAMAAEGIG